MKSRLVLSAYSRQLAYWIVLLILLVSISGCEFQQNPKPPSAENPAIQDLSLVTPDENIAIQDLPFVDSTQWYVSTTGDDANHCHASANACRNIQTAIDRASESDTIHIADGSYFEQLLLTKPLKIDGASREGTIIDAQLNNRPLTLDGTSKPNGIGLDLSDITLTGGATGKGGGFYLERGSWVVLTNVEIRNNVGHSAGGGIYANNTAYLNLNNVLVHDNATGSGGSTSSRGGGIFFGTGEDGTGAFPDFFVLNVNDSLIYGNSAYYGGGVFNAAKMNIMRSLVESNNAESGGGVYNEYDGTVGQSDVFNNTAVRAGGGIFNGRDFPGTVPGMSVFESEISGNSAKLGAGIFNEQGLGLVSSTISKNTASMRGGGICNETNLDIYQGGSEYSGKLFAINSTISGNSAPVGGGVWNGDQPDGFYFPGLFEAKNITIADNTGGGIYYHYGSLSLTNVLLAYNGQNCDFADDFTVFNSISSDDTCAGFIEADPAIAALADNGGLTQTHALLPGSPARDAALDFPSLFTDQRQFVRPLDSDGDGVAKWDIGSFEAEYKTFPYITLIPTDTPTPVAGPQTFIPFQMPPCRQGPALLYAAVGLLTPNTSYPIMGVSPDRRWYALQFTANTRCWVRDDTGTPSGDPAFLEVIPFTIITVTPTLTPTPVNCQAISNESVCNSTTICEWVRPVTGGTGSCQKK